MLIYNVTTNIEETVQAQWVQWMKDTHIPQVLATGKFLWAKMTRVLVAEEMGGVTYSVQFALANRTLLQRYYEEDAPRLREDAQRLFAGKFVAFRTELEVVHEQLAPPPEEVHQLFAYGTLQEREVQRQLFSRLLSGEPDHLVGYVLAGTKVSGTYPNIVPAPPHDQGVVGHRYQLTTKELERADRYEGGAYERISVTLASGVWAWAYMAKNN
ncbi:DUF4286 family protein [Maribacter sp. 2307ULW6-5]|uniref:DUF4286 family protein n=1 Tax=Maribacter sp. 2307ULW6-5 TaxID=3386275 RepID=UPI0039BD868C